MRFKSNIIIIFCNLRRTNGIRKGHKKYSMKWLWMELSPMGKSNATWDLYCFILCSLKTSFWLKSDFWVLRLSWSLIWFNFRYPKFITLIYVLHYRASYHKVLSLYCLSGNAEKAGSICDMMEKNNVIIKENSFNHLVQCHIICG